jgi:hypothetical protein
MNSKKLFKDVYKAYRENNEIVQLYKTNSVTVQIFTHIEERKNYAVKILNINSKKELEEKMMEIELNKAVNGNDNFV